MDQSPPNDIPIYLAAAPPLISELFQHKTAALDIKNALDAACSVSEEKMKIVNQRWSSSGNAINPNDHTKFLLLQKWTSKLYKELSLVNGLLAEIESLMHTSCAIVRDCHDRNEKESQNQIGSSSSTSDKTQTPKKE